MKPHRVKSFAWLSGLLVAPLLLTIHSLKAEGPSPAELLRQLDDYPHARQVAFSEGKVRDYELGLGAMQKIRGSWRFKHGERFSGDLLRYTWQLVDGYTSEEVLAELERKLVEGGGAELLFSCESRACGHGAQWANRVFGQRVLYGRDELQRYRAYRVTAEGEYRLALYASARTADRQYLHADLLRIVPSPGETAP